jgi:hypothetical protein
VLRSGQPGGAGVHLTLHPYQGTVLLIANRDAEQSGADPDGDHGEQRRVALRDGWQVHFADRDSNIDVVLPHIWESDPERLACSGSASYSTTVDLPDLGPSDRVMIDFGAAPARGFGEAGPGGIRGHSYRAEIDPPVGVMAEVRVNDVDCGMVWAPPYVLDVSHGAVRGPNRVEITVRNTSANALAHDQQIETIVADSERRYGRRFRMQELDLAMEGTQSGLLAVPTLVITTSGS